MSIQVVAEIPRLSNRIREQIVLMRGKTGTIVDWVYLDFFFRLLSGRTTRLKNKIRPRWSLTQVNVNCTECLVCYCRFRNVLIWSTSWRVCMATLVVSFRHLICGPVWDCSYEMMKNAWLIRRCHPNHFSTLLTQIACQRRFLYQHHHPQILRRWLVLERQMQPKELIEPWNDNWIQWLPRNKNHTLFVAQDEFSCLK